MKKMMASLAVVAVSVCLLAGLVQAEGILTEGFELNVVEQKAVEAVLRQKGIDLNQTEIGLVMEYSTENYLETTLIRMKAVVVTGDNLSVGYSLKPEGMILEAAIESLEDALE